MGNEEKQPVIEQYIAAKAADIHVPSYTDKVTSGAFKGRTGGLWAGTAMGLAWGALVGGAIAVAVPSAAVQAVLISAAIGSGLGGTAGQVIGAAAGASAAAAREKERREMARDMEQGIRANPPSEAEMLESLRMHQERQQARGGTSFNTVQEIYAQQDGGILATLKQMINPKVMLTAMVLGAVVGAVLAAGDQSFIGSFLKTAFNVKDVSTPMKLAAGAGLGAVMSTSFGVNFPAIYTSLSHLAGRVLSGKIFDEGFSSPQPVPEKSLTPALAQIGGEPAKVYTQTVKPAEKAYARSVAVLSFQEALRSEPARDARTL